MSTSKTFGVLELANGRVHYWRGPLDLSWPHFDRPNAFVLSYPLIDPFLQFNPVFGG